MIDERRSSVGWLLAALLSPALLLLTLHGAPLGQPVADDWDFLHRALLAPDPSWLDGGGVGVYWRPLARQVYYRVFAGALLEHPWLVAAFHLFCMAATAALLYRAFRPTLGPVTAFAVSTGPWLMESSRVLIAWPSGFQDLGALLFVALAYHEAVAGRVASGLLAGLAAVLCKEMAAIPLLSLLVCPAVRLDPPRARRLTGGLLGLIGGWLAVSAWIGVTAHLLPRSHTQVPGLPFLLQGMTNVIVWTLESIFSLSPGASAMWLVVSIGVMVLAFGRRWREIAKEGELRAWWGWGLAWSVPLLLALVPFVPAWAGYRAPLVTFGLVTATAVTLRHVHRLALPLFIVVRLAGLMLAPRPVSAVSIDPPTHGSTIDVPNLTRLQRFNADVREALTEAHPTLLPHTSIVWWNLPAMAEHAFGARPAVHVWYRDTTLRWMPLRSWMAQGLPSPAAIVEYEPHSQPGAAVVEADAMRALLRGDEMLAAGADSIAVDWYRRAAELQGDGRAEAFLRMARGKHEFARARRMADRGDRTGARRHVLRVLELFPNDVPSRQLLRQLDRVDSTTSEGR